MNKETICDHCRKVSLATHKLSNGSLCCVSCRNILDNMSKFVKMILTKPSGQ